jgi:sugar transferase EpsL
MSSPLKRVFDVAASASLLLALAPVLVLTGACIRLKLGRRVLFRQERAGLHGRVFVLLKFRSMSDLRDAEGELLPDAQRLGRFGRLLRSTSLDELPELVNVLRGDMSLVGPRPLHVRYLPRYSARQARRHEVKPGITGWAQVKGRNALSWEEKLELDVWYADHWSLGLDLRIMALTVWKVLTREGIAQPGQATAGEFMGSAGSPESD